MGELVKEILDDLYFMPIIYASIIIHLIFLFSFLEKHVKEDIAAGKYKTFRSAVEAIIDVVIIGSLCLGVVVVINILLFIFIFGVCFFLF